MTRGLLLLNQVYHYNMKYNEIKIILTRKGVLTLMLAMLSLGIMAQTSITQEGVIYTLNGDHYEVTAFDFASVPTTASEDDVAVVIADDIEGVPVTVIADNAFDATINSKCAKITSVELGNHITTIGNYAFYLCKSLKELLIYYKLETIGQKAFYSCTALSAVELPATMKKVGNSAFYGCKAMTSLTVNADNLEIETSAFNACSSLRTIRFMGVPPTVGSTAFYGVGRSGSPAYVYVPEARLTDYVALMQGEGTDYGWKNGNGYMALRTAVDGLIYTYAAPKGDNAAYLQISAVDEATLVNKGTEASPAYLLQSVTDLYGYAVKDIADNAFSTSLSDKVYALDLRQASITGFNVDRTTGQFAGVGHQTIVYLPAGNTSTESNVIIGNDVATIIQVGRPARNLTADEVANGRATWLLNNLYGQYVFGQRIGAEAVPQLMDDAAKQTVWQAAFRHESVRQYRYANTNGTVTIPNAVDLGFNEGQLFNCYASDDIDKPFTSITPLTTDVDVYVYAQVTGLTISEDTLTFLMSAPADQHTTRLTVSSQPEGARAEVIWSSDKPAIASVDAKGNVTALAAGHVVVTATSKDNPSVSVQCRITVIPLPERVELSETDITIALSATSDPVHQLSATIYPLEAVQDVTWESQNEEICSVDENGLVTGLSNGKTTIVCTPKDNTGIMALCYVTVLPAANSVWISRNTYTMLPDDMEQLKARVLPGTAIQTIVWSTSDAEVATVSDQGVVVAKKPGVATVTATSYAMPSLSNKCVITVAGVGTKATIKDITYQITALDADNLHMTITKIPDAIVNKGDELIIPDSVYYARLYFYVREVADTAIGTPTNNTLIYIPNGITYKGTAPNVVVADKNGAKCAKLILNYAGTFSTSHTFTAAQVEYVRPIPIYNQGITISLPYSVKSEENKVHYFKLTKQEDDLLIFDEVDETEPYAPYLAITDESSIDLGGSNIKIGPMTRNTDVYVGDVQFMATMRSLDYDYLSAANGCLLDNFGFWRAAAPKESASPFTAWLSSPHEPLYIDLNYKDWSETGIRPANTAKAASSRIYDLRGRYLGNDASQLPSGIYIRNGKKFVK